MGSRQLDKPKRMGEKVRALRLRLGFTQEEMYKALVNQGAKIHVGYVGLYETNERIPTLLVTLAYARTANISTDNLIDDQLDLPEGLKQI